MCVVCVVCGHVWCVYGCVHGECVVCVMCVLCVVMCVVCVWLCAWCVCVCGVCCACVMWLCVRCVFLKETLNRSVCDKELRQVLWHAITLKIFLGSLESKRPRRSEIKKVTDSSGLKCCHHLVGVYGHTLRSNAEVSSFLFDMKKFKSRSSNRYRPCNKSNEFSCKAKALVQNNVTQYLGCSIKLSWPHSSAHSQPSVWVCLTHCSMRKNPPAVPGLKERGGLRKENNPDGEIMKTVFNQLNVKW